MAFMYTPTVTLTTPSHYGSGAAHLPPTLLDNSTGGNVGAIGYALDKCTAYATNWDTFAATEEGALADFTPTGLKAEGYDIWTGGTKTSEIPRITEHTSEKLLGKRGCITDRHTEAGGDTIVKLQKLYTLAHYKHASWDETAMLAQLIGRGVLAYVPLVGIPRPKHSIRRRKNPAPPTSRPWSPPYYRTCGSVRLHVRGRYTTLLIYRKQPCVYCKGPSLYTKRGHHYQPSCSG